MPSSGRGICFSSRMISTSWTQSDVGSRDTHDGSRSDLAFRPRPALWDEIASDSGNCLGRNCPSYNDCFYYKARRRAQHAQILVVNHALFFSDLALRQAGVSIIPDYDAVIFDEAHTLEAVASDHLGLRLTNGQLDYNLRRLFNDRTNKGLLVDGVSARAQQQVNACRDEVDRFFGDVDDWINAQAAVVQRSGRRRHGSSRTDSALPWSTWPAGSSSGPNGLGSDVQRQDFVAAAERLVGLADLLDRWLGQTLPESVYWVDRAYRPSGHAPVLRWPPRRWTWARCSSKQLFQAVPSVIMTSATLSTGTSNFDYFQRRLGVPRAQTLKVGSPVRLRASGDADSGDRSARSGPRAGGLRTDVGGDDRALRVANRGPSVCPVHQL